MKKKKREDRRKYHLYIVLLSVYFAEIHLLGHKYKYKSLKGNK